MPVKDNIQSEKQSEFFLRMKKKNAEKRYKMLAKSRRRSFCLF